MINTHAQVYSISFGRKVYQYFEDLNTVCVFDYVLADDRIGSQARDMYMSYSNGVVYMWRIDEHANYHSIYINMRICAI